MSPPHYVLVADAGGLTDQAARRVRRGHRVVASSREAVPGSVYAAEVADLAAAAEAVLAALTGADLLLAVTADDATYDALLEDLSRLGTVEHAPTAVALSSDQVALLSHLHAGMSLGEAARAEHLSRRTADRRVATARRTLGVRTTTEALVAAAGLGLLD